MDVIKKIVALSVPAHFAGMVHQLEDMQVTMIRAGLPEQDKRRREEMLSFIILAPSRRVDSIKISLSRDLRARTLPCFYARIFKFSAITNSHISPDEGSIAETSEFYLQLSAFSLPTSHF